MNIIITSKKNIICFLFIFIFLFSFYSFSLAQSRKSLSQYVIGGCLAMGISFVDLEPVNEAFEFKSPPYNTFTPEKVYFGGLGYFVYNRFIIALDGGFIRKGTDSPIINVKYSNNALFFNAGYSVISELKGVGCPFIGIGLGSTSLKFNNFKDGEIFQTIDLKNNNIFNYESVLIQVGYCFLRMGDYTRIREKKNGILFGIQGGYIYSLGNKKWNANGKEVPDLKATFDGLYVKFLLGWWRGRIF